MARSAVERYLLTLLYKDGHHRVTRKGPLITISRDYGAGAREVAAVLAKRLAIPLYGKEIIEAIIHLVEGDPSFMQRLDESTPPGLIERLIKRYTNTPSSDEYARALVEIVLLISQHGGVILGRGVHLIATVPDMFRIYLHASPEVCISRIAKREGLDSGAAASKWRRTMGERQDYLKHYFGHTHDEFSDFDLAIKTDDIQSLENIVDIIIAGLHARGLGDTLPTI